MTATRTHLLSGIALVVCLLAAPTAVMAVLDTSGPVVCAFTKAFDCDAGEGCEATDSESVGLPDFFKLDFAKNEVVAADPHKGPVRENNDRIRS